MNSTLPLLVGFTRPESSTDDTGSFIVGAWIPDSFQNEAPLPRKEDGIEVERYSRASYFVGNWTGAPATAGTVATKADELAKALDEDKVRSLSFRFFLFFVLSRSHLSLSLSLSHFLYRTRNHLHRSTTTRRWPG